MGPTSPLRSQGPLWATLAGPGLGLPFSPWDESLQVTVWVVLLERVAPWLFLSHLHPPNPFQVLNHLYVTILLALHGHLVK